MKLQHCLPLLLLAALACNNPKTFSPNTPPLTPMEMENLNQRLFFAHQSVGQNLLQGLSEMGNPLPQRLLPPSNVEDAFSSPGLVNTLVGENMKPLSKIEHFEKILTDGVGNHADFAMLKLCYIDIEANTDVEALFQRYEESYQRLRSLFPALRFAHITTPLTTVESGAKSWLKKALGKTLWGIAENQKREAFNQKLRDTYAGKEPLFDLALLESTYPDGTRETFEHEGMPIPALIPAMSDDGGHLNPAGRAHIASAFARFLASLPKNTGSALADSPTDNTP